MDGAKKRIDDFKHIGNILCDVLNTFRLDPDLELTRLFSLWDDVVGEALAKNARPAGFKGKILLVNVVSSVWIQELQYYREDMIRKLNEALGKELVSDIKFKIGPV
jgi:predicted nucleic acid-binding Zn ribbon protein